MLNFLMPPMWHQIPHAELRHNFRCRKCPICAPNRPRHNFRCRKCPICAPNRPRHNFRCIKTLFLTPNCLPLLIPVQKMPNFDTESHTPQLPVQKMPNLCTKLGLEQLPVQKMPHLCTKPATPQLPVQKNTLFGTKSRTLNCATTSGAENAPKPSKTPRRNVFSRPPWSAGRSGSCGK